MSTMKCINYSLYLYFTIGLKFIYGLKDIFGSVVFCYLSYITASSIISDSTPYGKAYLVLSIVITALICVDKYIISTSLLIQFISTFDSLINLGQGCEKIYNFSRYKTIFYMSMMFLVELIKLLAGVYCFVILIVYDYTDVLVNLIVLGMLMFESFLGCYLYLLSNICILFIPNFFYRWLRNMAKYYIPYVDYTVDRYQNIYIIRITGLRNNIELSPVNIVQDTLSDIRKKIKSVSNKDVSENV